MILGYIGVASIPLVLIVAAIAIPNLLRARMVANQSSRSENTASDEHGSGDLRFGSTATDFLPTRTS